MAGQDVFLTGGTGFIGKHFLKTLKENQRQVRCMARATSAVDSIRHFGCEIVTADLLNVDSLTKAIEGCRVVFHVAGKARNATRGDMTRTNVDGTRNIAIACKRQPNPPHLVCFSSLAASGPGRPGHPLTESDHCDPVSKYGESKLLAERAVRECAESVPVSILRPPIVFGEEDTVTLDIFKSIKRFRIYATPGYNDRQYSLIHADDLVNAALAVESKGERLAENDESRGVYFVSYARQFSGAEFAKAVGKSVDRNPIVLSVPNAAVKTVAAINEFVSATTPWKPFLNWDKAREATAGSWICDATKLVQDTDVELADPTDRFRQTAEGYCQKGWL